MEKHLLDSATFLSAMGTLLRLGARSGEIDDHVDKARRAMMWYIDPMRVREEVIAAEVERRQYEEEVKIEIEMGRRSLERPQLGHRSLYPAVADPFLIQGLHGHLAGRPDIEIEVGRKPPPPEEDQTASERRTGLKRKALMRSDDYNKRPSNYKKRALLNRKAKKLQPQSEDGIDVSTKYLSREADQTGRNESLNVQEKKDVYFCEFCGVECPNWMIWEKHLEGKKHIKIMSNRRRNEVASSVQESVSNQLQKKMGTEV